MDKIGPHTALLAAAPWLPYIHVLQQGTVLGNKGHWGSRRGSAVQAQVGNDPTQVGPSPTIYSSPLCSLDHVTQYHIYSFLERF